MHNPTWTRRSSTLSEFGSQQLEFAKLSMHSGNSTYADKAESVIQYLYEQHSDKVRAAMHASCVRPALHTIMGIAHGGAFHQQGPYVTHSAHTAVVL